MYSFDEYCGAKSMVETGLCQRTGFCGGIRPAVRRRLLPLTHNTGVTERTVNERHIFVHHATVHCRGSWPTDRFLASGDLLARITCVILSRGHTAGHAGGKLGMNGCQHESSHTASPQHRAPALDRQDKRKDSGDVETLCRWVCVMCSTNYNGTAACTLPRVCGVSPLCQACISGPVPRVGRRGCLASMVESVVPRCPLTK